ncbi:hypothetical protein [Mucilaginibacter xinganensis]|uniref:Uncharacterized protein n=1 Tax=Mucilaginibacter xinganensis TaxID=1234841 RepID=A0A223NWZ6_9SPHI|nr:hypothetical protein [Mucilaginibacter xinganensis]ASU34382.1 hypothetical protein MuYL_2495 [Mucilaginibacter xinganensis]
MILYQAKALFNAQYLGQTVLSHIEAPNLATTLSSGYLFNGDKEWFLLLRTVDQLTDDECVNIAAIVGENPFNRYRNMVVTRDFKITGFPYIAVSHKNIKQRFNIDCTHINFSMYEMDEDISGQIDMKPYACIDYLRSIGILLPFTYLTPDHKPVTLQPDEIIKLGWAKIKGVEVNSAVDKTHYTN